MDIDKDFGEIQDKYYPGSKKLKRSAQKKKAKGPPPKASWRMKIKIYRVDGVDREFYPIGALADALDKKPVTIRMWMQTGKMPEPRFRTPKIGEQKGRRLWTRKQIEALQKAAQEELKYHKVRDFSKTFFTEKATAIMKDSELSVPDEHKENKK